MKQSIRTSHKISAVLLLVLFLLPIFTQVMHAFSDHDHPVCTDVTTHMHKLEKDCEISAFHYTPYHYAFTEIILRAYPQEFKQFNKAYKNSFYFITRFTKGQRGPPTLS